MIAMIDVKCLASGSSGNSYAIDDGKSVLLLEAGLPAKKISSGYCELLPRVAGCLITHEHQDHARGASDLAARGIDLYATSGTFSGIEGIDRPYRCHAVRRGEQFELASWSVLPFETEHDAAEPCGYLVYSHAAGEKLLFATDTYYIPNTFRELNVMMIECNYSLQILNDNIFQGIVPSSMKNRLLHSHFGIDNVKDFIRVNDTSKLRKIYLIHLSKNNADRTLFEREIRSVSGRSVTVF